ncbi:MAG: M23 family metallopeptidase [Candidatus Kerfeldbacteria bacterium]|nr:M23 family metallopeptidase [Candidatus Kerfeldbacteria bacterium]
MSTSKFVLWWLLFCLGACFTANAQDVAESFQLPFANYPINDGCYGWAVYVDRDGDGDYEYHLGDDACVSAGTDNYAVADGVVMYAGAYTPCPDWEYLIVIEHTMSDGSKVCSIYGHVAPAAGIYEGMSVAKGQYIGDIADLDSSCSPDHIHFGIYDGPFSEIYCDGPGYCYTAGYASSTGNYTDPVAFIQAHDECTTTVTPIYSTTPVKEMMMLTDPDGDAFDFHAYYYESSALKLLNRSDMGEDYTDPVINNQGSTQYYYQWLSGDVTGDGFMDIVLITHQDDGTMRAKVWVAGGNGTWEDQTIWMETTEKAKKYYLGRWKSSDGIVDSKLDLIRVFDRGNGVIEWQHCDSNGSGGFGSCAVWASDFGSDLSTDIFVVGDFTGDSAVDVLRGYNTSDTTQACETGGYKLKWRLLKGGSTSEYAWLSNWGCKSSRYLAGDATGDKKFDLVQVRFDSSGTKIYVAKSSGTTSTSQSQWKSGFGSSSHSYYTYDVNSDGKYDVLAYKDDSSDVISAANSSGTSFGSTYTILSGYDRETSGDFLFGKFGDIYLKVGEEENTVCQ